MSPALALSLVLLGGLLLTALVLDDLAARIKVPGILLVLVLGLLIDNEAVPGIQASTAQQLLTLPHADQLAQLALVLVLFFGGLTAQWRAMRPVLRPALRLASLGSLATAGAITLVVLAIQSLPVTAMTVKLPVALFVGAMFCSTDASAVMALLRPLHAHLPPRLIDLLEGESGFNDPIAVILAGLALAMDHGGSIEPALVVVDVLREFLLGAFLGFVGGQAAAVVLSQRRSASYGSLAAVVSLALLMLITGGAVLVGASGLLAAYLMGLVLGNSPAVNRDLLVEGHAGFAKLAELCLFLCLGLVVQPTDVVLALRAALLLAVSLLLVRWLVVSALMLRSGFRRSERHFLVWAGMRGAVPIAIALHAAASDVSWGRAMPPVALAVVLMALLGQGLVLTPLARRFGLIQPVGPDS